MAVLTIRTYPDPALRKRCRPVKAVDAGLAALAADMAETLRAAPGVGLAAPQVGEDIRLIVVDLSVGTDPAQLHVLMNPEVVSAEGEQMEEEGCLSLPGVHERVRRALRVRVRALNPRGEEILLDGQGVLARVLLHEMDHLEGKLILDHLNREKRDVLKKRLKRLSRAAS
ncbi:MAG: peptide deformylase [Candidatus Tectomicrobia bacterium]|uniref:Peptide deformylase n=1 Tax=Tectimicrobiota bacterium TaxID=2528274 RepID=A0A932I2Y8_UNCTE|nr:peptide deformylase [Candidatus Tectomicrobia bacterium]